jgi:hypothetical protein
MTKSDIYFRPSEGREQIASIIYHIEPIAKEIKSTEAKKQLESALKDLKALEKSLWIAEKKIKEEK